ELRRGSPTSARVYFERAVAQGSRNAQLLRDYARLDRSKARTLLPQALALAPDDVDVRLACARLLLEDGKAERALLTLHRLGEISREQAFTTCQTAANAYLQLGRVDDARAAALKVSQYADSGGQAAFAKRLLSSIDEAASRRATPPAR